MRNAMWLAVIGVGLSAVTAAAQPLAPEVVVQPGHTSPINAVAFSPDGKRLLMAADDKTVTVWDAETGKPLRTSTGHTATVTSLALSRDSKRLLTGSADKTVIVWDLEAGKQLLKPIRHTAGVNSVAFSPDGKSLLTGSSDKKVTMWDADQGKEIFSLARDSAVTSAAFSPDGKRILVGSEDGVATVANAGTGALLFSNSAHTGRINSVAYSPDGETILTGSEDKTVKLSQASTGKLLRTLSRHRSGVNSVAFSPDSKRILTGSSDKFMSVWEADTGNILFSNREDDSVTSVAFSPDGKRILTGSRYGTARLWDAATGKYFCSLVSLDSGKDWLVVTPDGLFDGSPNADRFLSLRLRESGTQVDLAQYRKQYFRPDLLAAILKGEKLAAQVPVAQALPPTVRFLSPDKATSSVITGKLTVKVQATPRGEQPVRELRLLVDGRPLPIVRVPDPKVGPAEASWEVTLDVGKHTLKALADTALSQGVSDEITVTYVGGTTAPPIELPRLYVLSIGVAAYNDESLKLNYAARDAQAVDDAFRTHAKPLFKSIKTNVITDKDATRAGILKGVDWLRREMTQKDVGVLFFSGHGEKDSDGTLYFLPVDADPTSISSSCVRADQITKPLAMLPGRVVLMLDACHSGGIDGGKKKSAGGLTDNLLRDLSADENGLITMASSTGNEVSLENNTLRMGNFAAALTEGLAGKATKSDGAIYITQLDSYITDRVKELSAGKQHPVTGKPTSVRSFPLTKP